MVAKYSYSYAWLDDHRDFPTILNNFVFLFDFANSHMQWLLPSFASELGVFERFLSLEAKDNYKTGASFLLKDQSSLLQTLMYDQFLRTTSSAQTTSGSSRRAQPPATSKRAGTCSPRRRAS